MDDQHLTHFAAQGLRFPVVPEREGYVTSRDARLWHASFGTGPAVLFLHGGMGNATNWGRQVGFFAGAGYQVVVVDTRGHGRSTAGSQPFSYGLLAEDVLAVLDKLELPRASLVGWSDGACTALELARTRPERVARVVFFACNVDPTGTKPFVMTPTIGNCLARHRLDFENLTPTFDRFDDLGPKLEPMQKNEPDYSTQDLRAIGVPVAVLQAEHDEFIHRAHAEGLATTLPHATFDLLADVSHFAPVQHAALFNEVVLRRLRGFDPVRS